MASMVKTLAAFGVFSLLYLLVSIYSTFSQFFRPSSLPRYLHRRHDRDEAWAFVTGASDGIGSGIAEELAHRGFNVVLHGRNASKIASFQKSLEQKFPQRRFRPLIADASTTGEPALTMMDKILGELRELNLTVLINNVGAGMGDRQYTRFLDRSLPEVTSIMMVNECFPTLLTRALLPHLIENQPALIVNVGSVLDSWPSPYLEPYSGTKAHNRAFSDALRSEMALEGYDIEILHLRVLSVATPSSREQLSAMTVSPRTMARGLLDRVGCGEESTYGCLRHAIIGALMGSLMPRSVLRKSMADAMKPKIAK